MVGAGRSMRLWAIQAGPGWGKGPPWLRPVTISALRAAAARRCRSSSLALLAALIGLFVYLGMRETSVPQQRIEQDVTNEVLK